MLDAALELLVEVGYDNLSIDAIAARCHASKATFYRRWANKAEVVSEALRHFKSQCGEDPNLDTGTLRGDLLAKVGWLCAEVSHDCGLVAGVLRAMRGDPALAELVHQQVLGGKLDSADGMVERAVRRGELAPDAPVEVAFEVAASMVVARAMLGDGSADGAYAAHIVDDVLLRLLRAPAATPPDAPDESPPDIPSPLSAVATSRAAPRKGAK